jgi:hypothetical protein
MVVVELDLALRRVAHEVGELHVFSPRSSSTSSSLK